MTKVALYARYSSDLQTDKSIEDQLRVCRERAKAEGWEIVEAYTDRALSGASMMRPGLQDMLLDAQAGQFNVVLTEALDRVSRDQEDVAHIYKRLRFASVALVTLSEGEVNELHIGFSGTINAVFLKTLADKTRRGLKGRALAGKSAGGISYGYDMVRQLDGAGQLIRGDREINPSQAAVVVRIFEDYAKGKSPRKIAGELNAEGVAGPSGKGWAASTINGNRRRGTGIINNELYAGILVWNRQSFQKNPATGKRVARMNKPEAWERVDVPHLRIVDQALWDKVKLLQSELDVRVGPMPQQRPQKLFSFLLKCGDCGGGFAKISRTHYGCSTARNKGTCCNRLGIGEALLEERVLGALRSRLMEPELCETFCKEYTAHTNRLRMNNNAARHQHQAELEKAERRIKKLIDAIGDGCDPKMMKDELNGLGRKREELTALLEHTEEAPVFIHPNMAHRYHAEVQQLIASLNDPNHRDESAQLIRRLIDKIVLAPNEDRSALAIDLHGDLAGILQMSERRARGIKSNSLGNLSRAQEAEVEQVKEVVGLASNHAPLAASGRQQVAMVAGAGFEPATFRL